MARARGAPLLLLVAGEGELAPAVAAAGGEAVRMLGFQADVQRVLAASELFVMPSAREGTSLAVLEAMASGLAAVVSDGPGNPEAVGDAGVVVPFGAVGAFSEALERLTREPLTRKRLASAAQERVAREFSIESFLSGTRRVYEEALLR
jgi:glycosyltransferase involved in cell wall biosynthesis